MKQQIYINPKELLDDDQFILWCLHPTKESDRQWNERMEKNSDQVILIEQAKEMVFSVRLNDYKMPRNEHENLYIRILQDLNKK